MSNGITRCARRALPRPFPRQAPGTLELVTTCNNMPRAKEGGGSVSFEGLRRRCAHVARAHRRRTLQAFWHLLQAPPQRLAPSVSFILPGAAPECAGRHGSAPRPSWRPCLVGHPHSLCELQLDQHIWRVPQTATSRPARRQRPLDCWTAPPANLSPSARPQTLARALAHRTRLPLHHLAKLAARKHA
jgi:hypothetical protein